MISKATTISGYLKELPPDRRAALTQLRSLINKIAPKAVEGMKYGLPAFCDICALASQKNHMAIHICDPVAVNALPQETG